jgi:hypothetical protein
MDNQNDEFWGHNTFIGENAPAEAVIQFHLKAPVKSLALRIADTGGSVVRTIDIPASRNEPGIQSVCWDYRVDPIAVEAGDGGREGGGRGGRGGRGGGGGRGAAVPGVPQPLPPAGFRPTNPCAGGGGGGVQGPWVLPGSYNVSLMVDGQAVGTKPMSVMLDPANPLTDAQRRRYFDVAMDLHRLQERGTAAANALTPLHQQMTDLAEKIGGMSNVPEAVKTQFAAAQKEFESVRQKLGVPVETGDGGGRGGGRGGRGGGRGGGGGFGSPNLVARTGAIKGRVMSFYDTPSESMLAHYNDVRVALPQAIAEANAFLGRLTPLSQALKKYDLALTVPPPVK